jgi:hypothetical protein
MDVNVVRSEHWPPPMAHREFWERYNCAQVYEYDPTDDGPEVEVITRILGADWYYDIDRERDRRPA